jgi:ABC-type multidrug transport system ATPase subunit
VVSAGTVTVNGKHYAQLPAPMHEVGALLDAGAMHDGRSARNHLLCLAQTNGIARRRVDEVLGAVGLLVLGRGQLIADCSMAEDQVSEIAFVNGIRLRHLAATQASLEQAFMELTADSVEYRAGLQVEA